jgi:CRP/FNR family transcriptional regulator, nitrogen oxide reductase regulator
MTTRRKSPIDTAHIEPQMCSIDLRLTILSQVPFFQDLPHEDLGKINNFFVEKGYSSGQAICQAGDVAERLYVVADGNVKLMQHTFSGQDVMLDVLKPGEFFGSLSILGDQEYSETAIAQTECCVISIGADEFRRILRDNPAVALKVIDIMSGRLKSAHEMIRQLSARSVEQRLAYILLKLAEKLGQEKDYGLLIQLPLSRGDLAEMVGTTTESASRVMSQFQKEGLVRSGRRWVAITDREGLMAYKEGMGV